MNDAIAMAVLAARLRLHARRCKNEQGYKTPGGMPRAAFAATLRKWAKQYPHSDGSMDEEVRKMLLELDEVNA